MIRKKITLLLLASFWFATTAAFAQNDLHIGKVFDLYGKKKGVVMVDLSGELLDQYRLTRFRSITIKDDPEAAEYARKCLERDQVGAKKIKEVVANGVPTSIYLQLPRLGQDNRLILYHESRSGGLRITLIYIESNDDTEAILKLLLKKKQ
jgi:hypothetical protein